MVQKDVVSSDTTSFCVPTFHLPHKNSVVHKSEEGVCAQSESSEFAYCTRESEQSTTLGERFLRITHFQNLMSLTRVC